VADAARVIEGITYFANNAADPARGPLPQPVLLARDAVKVWAASPVCLRLDDEFAQALLDSDADTEINPDWLDRCPFASFSVTLAEPLSLFDGEVLCHYHGFIALGITSRPVPGPTSRDGLARARSTYGPLADADGVRGVWLYTEDGDPRPRLQSVTALARGLIASGREWPQTISGLIEAQREMTASTGQGWGQELSVLAPLTLLLPMYLAASDPDLDWLPPETTARPQQIQTAKVANLGWRVGSAVRTYRRQDTEAAQAGRTGAGGWRLPPHIRRAHWHRVRIATRDETGTVIGDRLGEHGVHWHYESRWIPPTPVNAVDGQVAPVVRPLDASPPGD
jgi:hypothetical protein